MLISEIVAISFGEAYIERNKIINDIVTNNPSELIIIIPELATGTYKLEITTQFSGNIHIALKEPHTAIFDKILTVQ